MPMPSTMWGKLQLAGLVIAFALLLLFDFGGAYYAGSSTYRTGTRYDVSTDSYRAVYGRSSNPEYVLVRLGSGAVPTVMVLLGLGAIGYALKASWEGASDRANAGAAAAVGLAVVGAVMLAATLGDASEWWLDAGFYGTFFGGLTAVVAGRMARPGAA